MNGHDTAVYRFGGFLLVPRERVLLHEGEPVALAGKAFDLLAALVSQAGQLATKDELLRRVWPGLVVEEVNLSVNMSAIRKALACSPDAAEWIETVPRQGYRFKALVGVDDIATFNASRLSSTTAHEPLEALSPLAAKRIWPKSAWVASGALALALAVGLGWLAFGRAMPYAALAVLPFASDTPANAHLADGIAEEAINALTRLICASRHARPRFAFAPLTHWTPDGGSMCQPSSGSLASSGERLTLQVEVVDVARAAQVWSSRYEVALADLPQLQGRVIGDLTRWLGVRSTASSETKHLARDPTRSADAYRAYLQGRFLWNQRAESALGARSSTFAAPLTSTPDSRLPSPRSPTPTRHWVT